MMDTWVWTFEIDDVVKFEGTKIELHAPTYKEALDKVKALNLPSLRAYTQMEDKLKLVSVIESILDREDEQPTEETIDE
jgi:hypothetical protein